MKKPLTATLLAAAAVATLAVPAGAAVPKRPASQTVPCNDGSGKSAQVWQRPGQLAAKNPCHQWLLLAAAGNDASGAFGSEQVLAPGAHFNWGKKQAWAPTTVGLWDGGLDSNGLPCGDGESVVYLIYSYKDVRPASHYNC